MRFPPLIMLLALGLGLWWVLDAMGFFGEIIAGSSGPIIRWAAFGVVVGLSVLASLEPKPRQPRKD